MAGSGCSGPSAGLLTFEGLSLSGTTRADSRPRESGSVPLRPIQDDIGIILIRITSAFETTDVILGEMNGVNGLDPDGSGSSVGY